MADFIVRLARTVREEIEIHVTAESEEKAREQFDNGELNYMLQPPFWDPVAVDRDPYILKVMTLEEAQAEYEGRKRVH